MERSQEKNDTHVKGQRPRTIHFLIAINTYKRLPPFIQRILETDHNELEGVRRVRPDVICNPGDIRIVQCGVNFI